jgi:hypothetical protein
MKTSTDLKQTSSRLVLLWAVTVFVVCDLIPLGSLPWRSAGAAVLFTASVALDPQAFRTRSGSLLPAYWLTGFVWLCAAVVLALSAFGAH